MDSCQKMIVDDIRLFKMIDFGDLCVSEDETADDIFPKNFVALSKKKAPQQQPPLRNAAKML